MSDVSAEMNFASLMDLAVVDTSELSAQTSRLQRQGIYIVELSELKFQEQPPQDPANPMNYNLVVNSNVLQFYPLNPEDANAKLEGTNLRERIFFFGENLKESVQLMMGRFKQVGFKHKGPLGGVEGAPGWLDEAVGKRIALRVRHYVRRSDGQEVAAIDWLTPKAMEKADLPWDTMARPFLNDVGEEVDIAA